MSTVSRRGVLGGASMAVVAAGAAFVPTAAVASTAPGVYADAALLALCVEFWRLDALVEASNRNFDYVTDAESNRLFDLYNDGLWPDHSGQIDLIVSTEAHTVAGMRAKAAVAQGVLRGNNQLENWEDGNEEERLALSLVRDLLRSGAGGMS